MTASLMMDQQSSNMSESNPVIMSPIKTDTAAAEYTAREQDGGKHANHVPEPSQNKKVENSDPKDKTRDRNSRERGVERSQSRDNREKSRDRDRGRDRRSSERRSSQRRDDRSRERYRERSRERYYHRDRRNHVRGYERRDRDRDRDRDRNLDRDASRDRDIERKKNRTLDRDSSKEHEREKWHTGQGQREEEKKKDIHPDDVRNKKNVELATSKTTSIGVSIDELFPSVVSASTVTLDPSKTDKSVPDEKQLNPSEVPVTTTTAAAPATSGELPPTPLINIEEMKRLAIQRAQALAAQVKETATTGNESFNQWESTSFADDEAGARRAKFLKLMGAKKAKMENPVPPADNQSGDTSSATPETTAASTHAPKTDTLTEIERQFEESRRRQYTLGGGGLGLGL